MHHTRSKLTLSYSTARKPSSQPSLRSQYSTQSLPSYRSRPSSHQSRRAATTKLPPSYDDLMRTVDYRFHDQPPRYRRSSFALSDIWEEDEVEIEISDVLPGSPEYEESIELQRKRTRFAQKLVAFVVSLRYKWQRAGIRTVTNVGFSRELDLLA
ncbi:hypothetical protein BXZ70DRAFT_1003813 [Cristinia sonorae]|uniref:Uncharacterized protein n=1 Tax=Cristinia sonorae TaxID=1940300 RepID=A0A8K0UYF4_9AGAR|nr:hypothetical protein BXZ70DRAFT_1003813 [Cristinia sonorae]